MLIENQEFISFEPGCHCDKSGKRVLGKIVVHDRVKVESSILPRYFNHSSFASLRRQLNYFAFTRIGKGRQRGATYCNEGVVVLEDILSLKRRSVSGNSTATVEAANAVKKVAARMQQQQQKDQPEDANSAVKRNPNKRMRMTPATNNKNTSTTPTIIGANSSNSATVTANQTPNCLLPPPARVTPVEHLISNDEHQVPKRLSLDLTTSSPTSTPIHTSAPLLQSVIFNTSYRRDAPKPTPTSLYGDDDILAGCKALLCFSRGIPSR